MTGKIVNFHDLKAGDKVTAVNLKTGEVISDVVVDYNARTFEGFSYTKDNKYGGDVQQDKGPFVIFRWNSNVPENWPPRPGDVWRGAHFEFFVTKKNTIVSNYGDIQTLQNLLDDVEKRDMAFTLVYRKDVKEAGK